MKDDYVNYDSENFRNDIYTHTLQTEYGTLQIDIT